MTKLGANRIFSKLSDNTDESWRTFGRKDPYFGVFSADKFRSQNLNDDTLAEFFQSGENHVSTVLAASRMLSPGMASGSALDFGCGVGRLVLPLSRNFQAVTGVDISPDYIAEASRNCAKNGLTNVDFSETVDALAARGLRYDFIHSCIVFNHIPWARGREIIRTMYELLAPGGVMAIQVLHRHRPGRMRRIVAWARRNFLPVNWIANLLSGRPALEPLMQGNAYPLDELLPMLSTLGADRIQVGPEPKPNGQSFAFVFCRKAL